MCIRDSEGGFAPDLKADEEAIEWILKAIDQAGLNGVVWLALDAAASEWATGEGLSLIHIFVGGFSAFCGFAAVFAEVDATSQFPYHQNVQPTADDILLQGAGISERRV